MFVGRKKELKYLEDNYHKAGSQVLVVYGHKGVGKTTLMSRFVQEKVSAYYAARPLGEAEQLFQWNQEMEYRIPGEELSFDAILHKMYSEASEDKNVKDVMIIDEFQNIVKYSEDFMLQLMRFVKTTEHQCNDRNQN